MRNSEQELMNYNSLQMRKYHKQKANLKNKINNFIHIEYLKQIQKSYKIVTHNLKVCKLILINKRNKLNKLKLKLNLLVILKEVLNQKIRLMIQKEIIKK